MNGSPRRLRVRLVTDQRPRRLSGWTRRVRLHHRCDVGRGRPTSVMFGRSPSRCTSRRDCWSTPCGGLAVRGSAATSSPGDPRCQAIRLASQPCSRLVGCAAGNAPLDPLGRQPLDVASPCRRVAGPAPPEGASSIEPRRADLGVRRVRDGPGDRSGRRPPCDNACSRARRSTRCCRSPGSRRRPPRPPLADGGHDERHHRTIELPTSPGTRRTTSTTRCRRRE